MEDSKKRCLTASISGSIRMVKQTIYQIVFDGTFITRTGLKAASRHGFALAVN
jgi:hypothetical protein